ncbi:testis-expressed basic protein 1 isoform X4 [Mus caroli]|uniref:Testis-expressed basic protein 1 isoform X4 n=1 Tax=Mus caroli TaxID=10089 RepID=A0A6P5NX36_MUSCR|nr:testis-expressed basic protein 1 isoform X4 [Mus caroli]
MFFRLIGEIVLAVILTVLALAILTILIARWSRRRNNGAGISRFASEQSAGLLDHEDGISHGRHKRRGKQFRFLCRTGSVINEDPHCVSFPLGSRCSFSSDSGPSSGSVGGKSVSHHSLGPTGVSIGGKSVSHHSLGLSRSNPAINQGPQTIAQEPPSRTRSTKSLSEPLTGNAGDISGTIGPIMQFSAPIPGATGPIKLTQKTFLQTPGPIVQCMDSSESCTPEGSNAVIPVDICCQPALKPSCCQQLAIKPSCCQPCQPCQPCYQPCQPPPPDTLPLLITQRTSMKKPSDCKGQMVRHGGSVTFQGIGDDQIKCCKEWRRCQCEYCCPKRFDSHRRGTIWCEQPAPPSSSHQHQQHQQPPPPPPPPPPRSQDAQVRGDQRMESEIDAQTICYEEPFLFRRLESLIRRNQDGIVIKQNEDGFLIKKAEEGKKKRKTSKKTSAYPETDSDSSAPQTGEGPPEGKPPEEQPEGEEKKRKKEKKKKKKKDKDG